MVVLDVADGQNEVAVIDLVIAGGGSVISEYVGQAAAAAQSIGSLDRGFNRFGDLAGNEDLFVGEARRNDYAYAVRTIMGNDSLEALNNFELSFFRGCRSEYAVSLDNSVAQTLGIVEVAKTELAFLTEHGV